jgi:hypothetical protein
MRQVDIAADTKAVLLAASGMFLWALLLGAWKYRQIVTSEDHLAHRYVDIAHRAALLYSFALLLIAAFVQLSGWSELVNLLAPGAMTLYFYGAVADYALHGWRRHREQVPRSHAGNARLHGDPHRG